LTTAVYLSADRLIGGISTYDHISNILHSFSGYQFPSILKFWILT